LAGSGEENDSIKLGEKKSRQRKNWDIAWNIYPQPGNFKMKFTINESIAFLLRLLWLADNHIFLKWHRAHSPAR